MSRLILGDCLGVMKTFEDNLIDSVITDPPYGLKFMGKAWDHGIPGIPFWSEMLRVAKPGAIMLVFGGTRTYHRLACAIEDAGWRIRDCIMWMYGQGFPKSHDISKGIDRKAGKKRKVVGKDKRSAKNACWGKADPNSPIYDGSTYGVGEWDITVPGSKEAKLWDGYGTGLKPAWEPIIVAMKPLDGTYVENALKWGVAGLNIDGCRVSAKGRPNIKSKAGKSLGIYGDGLNNSKLVGKTDQGRFPANVILDEEAGRLLDEQTGNIKSSDAVRKNKARWGTKGIYGKGTAKDSYGYADSGGAARFFYCAKASKAERNAGCEGLEGYFQGKPEGGPRTYDDVCENCGKKFVGEKPCTCDNPKTKKRVTKGNYHPTVKPLKLLEYLCKLTRTPTGGVVLDPFIGSGTTAIACIRTGRECIGIEKDNGYFQIASARIKWEKAYKGKAK